MSKRKNSHERKIILNHKMSNGENDDREILNEENNRQQTAHKS